MQNDPLKRDLFCQPNMWSDLVFDTPVRDRQMPASPMLGVLKGEGVGPEVIQAALNVLSAVESIGSKKFDISFGGPIGIEAELQSGKPLSDEVTDFCRNIFSQYGAVMAGPGGGRFVYDLRKQFDLFCKLSPLKVFEEIITAAHINPEHIRNVDILLIRENVSGIYQGQWSEISTPNEGRSATQFFLYTEKQVRRIIEIAARIASRRRGKMSVVIKDGGIPAISKLWRDCAIDIASNIGIEHFMLNVDHAAYCLIQNPKDFDVVVAPNLFGDILADLGAVLLGSRGLSYSGNYASDGAAVYQTNHGAAYDLVGKNEANPVGQIFSLAMLLRESFGLVSEACLIEDAVADVWRKGWRTADLMETGCRLAGTAEMGNLITENVIRLSKRIT